MEYVSIMDELLKQSYIKFLSFGKRRKRLRVHKGPQSTPQGAVSQTQPASHLKHANASILRRKLSKCGLSSDEHRVLDASTHAQSLFEFVRFLISRACVF